MRDSGTVEIQMAKKRAIEPTSRSLGFQVHQMMRAEAYGSCWEGKGKSACASTNGLALEKFFNVISVHSLAKEYLCVWTNMCALHSLHLGVRRAQPWMLALTPILFVTEYLLLLLLPCNAGYLVSGFRCFSCLRLPSSHRSTRITDAHVSMSNFYAGSEDLRGQFLTLA